MARTKNFCEKQALDQLTEVFWQKGYNGASMDELLQQSGLSRSSMYDTFGDKHSLFIKALNAYAEKQSASLTQWMAEWNTTAEAVEALFTSSVSGGQCSAGARGCFLVNTAVEWSTSDPEINAIIRSSGEALIRGLVKLIRADQQKGIIAATHTPKSLASFIHNNLTGIRVSIKAGMSNREMADIKRMVLETMKQG